MRERQDGVILQPSDIKHFIITKSDARGPLSTSEVLHYFEQNPEILPSVQWISPESQTPLLLMEWFSDFAPEGELDLILSKAAPAPSSRFGRAKDTSSENSGSGSNAHLSKPSDFLTQKTRHRRWRDWLSLFGLGLLGAAIFAVGVRSLRPHRSLVKNENSLRAKLLSSTPDALRTYQLVLEAKIIRDPKKYASALLAIQKDKLLYPDEHLPSVENTAANALANLSHSELDKIEEWKQLLLSLPSEARQHGVAVVAYELSRIMSVRQLLLAERGKQKSKIIAGALEEVGIVVERLTRIVPGSEPADKLSHGYILARALSLSLVTAIEHPQSADRQKQLKIALDKIPELYPFLSEVDRELISILLALSKQRSVDLLQPADWGKALEQLTLLHPSTRYLCQLNDSGAAADTLLLVLSQASFHKQKIMEIPGLFDGCFVGLRAYPRVAVQSFTAHNAHTLEFRTVGAIDQSLLRDFRLRFPTMNSAIKRISGVKSGVGDWLLTLHFNGLLGSRLLGGRKITDKEKLCGKLGAENSLCMQAKWSELQGRWRDSLPLLAEFQEYASSADLSLMMQRFVLDASRDILLSSSKNKAKEILELFASLKSYGVADDPQLQFVLDYVRSIDSEI